MQLGREATADPGGGLLISNAHTSTHVLPGPSRFVSIGVPRKLMMALAPGLEDALVRPLPPDAGALRLLMRYLAVLEDTPRYIQKLFEQEATTLSRFVLGQRLARVHRMLTDPGQADLTIGTIAYKAGFGDLSTFNREFRRHFGATPSDIRATTGADLVPLGGSVVDQRFARRARYWSRIGR